MEDNNHIDELFRKGLNQNFPVDENLWAQVESQLPAQGGKSGLWVFNLNSLALLAILSISMVLKSDTIEKTKEISESAITSELTQTKTNENPLKETQQFTAIPGNESQLKKLNQKEIYDKTNIVEKVKVLEESNNTIGQGLRNESSKTNNDQLTKSIFLNKPNKSATTPEQKETVLADFSMLDFISTGELFPLNTNLNMQPIDKKNFWTATRKPYYYYELEVNKSLELSKSISGLPSEVENYKTERESGGTNTNFGLNLLTDYKYFQLGVGIRYSRYTEGLRYTVDAAGIGYDISFDTTYSIVNGSFNSNGEPVLLIKREIERIETEKGTTVKQNVHFRNEFERLQVPLLIGIHKNYGRFYGNLRASILINYSIQQTGAYVGNDLNQINNFEASEQINQFTIGNGYAASLGYSLNEFVVIGTRFNYETDLTSFTKDYKSRFSQYGLGFWMMWKPR